jgi:hypothetical protein
MTLTALSPVVTVVTRIYSEPVLIMIHRVRSPDARAVTGRAGVIELLSDMVRIRHLLVLRLMTLIAIGILQLVVAIHVARLTLLRDVGACQREACAAMVKRRRTPGCCRVTLRAVMVEVSCDVARIRRAFEVAGVTIKACRWQGLIVIVHMAIIAYDCLMCTGQRESRVVVTKR